MSWAIELSGDRFVAGPADQDWMLSAAWIPGCGLSVSSDPNYTLDGDDVRAFREWISDRLYREPWEMVA